MKKIPLLIQSLLSVIIPINKQVYADTLVNEPISNSEQIVACAPLAVSNNQDVVALSAHEDNTSINDSVIKEDAKEFTLTLEGREVIGKNYTETKANMELAIEEYELEQERLAKEAEEKERLEALGFSSYSFNLSDISNGDVWSIAQALVGTGGNCLYVANLFLQAYKGTTFSSSNSYQTDSPQPGDVIYYTNGGTGTQHWAIYLGGDSAMHGNFNGTTIIGSVYLNNASSPIFYSVN